jgi:hypothetical protein
MFTEDMNILRFISSHFVPFPRGNLALRLLHEEFLGTKTSVFSIIIPAGQTYHKNMNHCNYQVSNKTICSISVSKIFQNTRFFKTGSAVKT